MDNNESPQGFNMFTREQADRIYPCAECGVMRTKAEGGTTFTLCDACWEKAFPPAPQNIKPPNPWGADETMVIAAFRYCLGRMTYIVSDCCDWLIEQWPYFSEDTKSIIRRELDRAFGEDDAIRANPQSQYAYQPLGHDCDRAQWERVRRLWEVKG